MTKERLEHIIKSLSNIENTIDIYSVDEESKVQDSGIYLLGEIHKEHKVNINYSTSYASQTQQSYDLRVNNKNSLEGLLYQTIPKLTPEEMRAQDYRVASSALAEAKSMSDEEFAEQGVKLALSIKRDSTIAYSAITDLSLRKYQLIKQHLLKTMDAEKSVDLLKELDDDRLTEDDVKFLADKVPGSSRQSYRAGLEISDDRFAIAADALIKGVTRSASHSSDAALDWPYERFKVGAEKLAKAVAQDIHVAYAGDWGKDKFLLVQETILAGMVNRPSVEAYEAFRDWPDDVHELSADVLIQCMKDDEGRRLVDDVVKYPKLGARVKPYFPELFGKVAPGLVPRLIGALPREVYVGHEVLVADKLVESGSAMTTMGLEVKPLLPYIAKVLERKDNEKNRQLCVDLGMVWEDKLFSPLEETAIRLIGQDARLCYDALKTWRVEKSSDNYERLFSGMLTDSNFCLKIINIGSVVDLNGEIIYRLLSNPATKEAAKSHLSRTSNYIHVDNYRLQIFKAFGVEGDPFPVDNAERELWTNLFWRAEDQKLLAELPYHSFKQVSHAHQLAEGAKETEQFYASLSQTLQEGNVDKWATYIIDHFRKNSIGGGNYREVAW
jgi:hypothetical protein